MVVTDDLSVGGPGTTSVMTTALADESRSVSRLEDHLALLNRRLVSLDRVVGSGILAAADAPRSALLAEDAIAEARVFLARAIDDCDALARGSAAAARGYEAADHFADRLGQEVAAQIGYLVGSLAPILLAFFLPGALTLGAAWIGALAALPDSAWATVLSNLTNWFRTHSAALSDPGVVEAVRYSVMSADDAGWGLARAPQWLASLFGDEGMGVLGVDTSAGVLGGLAAGVGLVNETPVRVRVISSRTGIDDAKGVQDRIDRIPAEPEQIRIDRYSTPGEPDRFEVYIAGTAELALTGGAEPWDMTSNITAMSGASAGSYRAVEEAMQRAGIQQSSAVTITGYSQGGLIAAQLAASGDFVVDGLITVGAPAGQVAVPHTIPYLAIEHTNDLVPALGGTFVSSDPVIVRRQLFDGTPPPGEKVLPAHELSNYRQTAGLVDRSTNLKISETLTRFQHSRFDEVTSTLYRAERVVP